jgi:hypothetical protein
VAPLAGCTPESLAKEAIANAAAWNVPNLAPKLATRPVLVISSDDGLAPSNDAFVDALHKPVRPISPPHKKCGGKEEVRAHG